MNMPRAVKRSQRQEVDRSLIRHMGQASTFLNNKCDIQYLLSAIVLACFAPSQVLFPPEWVTFSSRSIVHVEQAVYVVVRAEAIRQVTEREYPVPDPSPVVLARREMHGEPANLHGGIDI